MQAQLSQAILQFNSKLRRKGSLAAYEIHAARSLHSGDNINISDTQLCHNQLKGRQKSQHSNTLPTETPQVGDTITPLSSQPNHVERNMCLITAASSDLVTTQKILHPLSSVQSKFMSCTSVISLLSTV